MAGSTPVKLSDSDYLRGLSSVDLGELGLLTAPPGAIGKLAEAMESHDQTSQEAISYEKTYSMLMNVF